MKTTNMCVWSATGAILFGLAGAQCSASTNVCNAPDTEPATTCAALVTALENTGEPMQFFSSTSRAPTGFPPPPPGSTYCITNTQLSSDYYITSADITEVLTYYQTALPADGYPGTESEGAVGNNCLQNFLYTTPAGESGSVGSSLLNENEFIVSYP